MPKEAHGVVRGESGVGVLALGSVLLHHDHLLEGKRTLISCGVCTSGLGGAVVTPEARRKEVGVAEGDGGDEGGNSAPPSGDWADRYDDVDEVPRSPDKAR